MPGFLSVKCLAAAHILSSFLALPSKISARSRSLTGAALSLLLPAPAAIGQRQTPVPNPPFPWHESAALLIFFVCMLAFCLLLPRML